MQINFKKLHPAAVAPVYATAGAACFDLHAIEGGTVSHGLNPKAVFATGLAFEVPTGHVMLVYGRSGHGFKNSTRLANCVGVIDSDYRGEVKVALTADQGGQITVEPGDRIAQAMIVPIPTVQLNEVAELSDTDRGTGGFGSTGA